MTSFEEPLEARNALMDFVIDRTAPIPLRIRQSLRQSLKDLHPGPSIKRAVELVYARQVRKGDVPVELREWAAATAVMLAGVSESMMENSRGVRIAKVLRSNPISEENIPVANEKAVEIADPVQSVTPIDPPPSLRVPVLDVAQPALSLSKEK